MEAFSLHPGVIQTPLGRHVGTQAGTWTGWLFGWLGAYWIKSTQQARRPALQACSGGVCRCDRACHSLSAKLCGRIRACGSKPRATNAGKKTDLCMLNACADATLAGRICKTLKGRDMTSKCTPLQGAATSIAAAVSPDLEGASGAYLSDCQVLDPSAQAQDEELAKRLWTLTEEQIAEADARRGKGKGVVTS